MRLPAVAAEGLANERRGLVGITHGYWRGGIARAAAELIGATPEEVLSAAYELLVAGFVGLHWEANGQGSPVPELPAFEEDFASVFMECCARHGVSARRIRWQKTEG